jgi:hypothetical protein
MGVLGSVVVVRAGTAGTAWHSDLCTMSYGCSTYATIVIEPVAVHEQSILLATASEHVFRLHVRTLSQPEAAQVALQRYHHDDQLYYQQEYALASPHPRGVRSFT